MARIVVIAVSGTLLAGCSGSNRVEDIVPAWANTPPRAGSPSVARKDRSEGRRSAEVEPRSRVEPEPPQEARKPAAQSDSEE